MIAPLLALSLALAPPPAARADTLVGCAGMRGTIRGDTLASLELVPVPACGPLRLELVGRWERDTILTREGTTPLVRVRAWLALRNAGRTPLALPAELYFDSLAAVGRGGRGVFVMEVGRYVQWSGSRAPRGEPVPVAARVPGASRLAPGDRSDSVEVIFAASGDLEGFTGWVHVLAAPPPGLRPRSEAPRDSALTERAIAGLHDSIATVLRRARLPALRRVRVTPSRLVPGASWFVAEWGEPSCAGCARPRAIGFMHANHAGWVEPSWGGTFALRHTSLGRRWRVYQPRVLDSVLVAAVMPGRAAAEHPEARDGALALRDVLLAAYNAPCPLVHAHVRALAGAPDARVERALLHSACGRDDRAVLAAVAARPGAFGDTARMRLAAGWHGETDTVGLDASVRLALARELARPGRATHPQRLDALATLAAQAGDVATLATLLQVSTVARWRLPDVAPVSEAARRLLATALHPDRFRPAAERAAAVRALGRLAAGPGADPALCAIVAHWEGTPAMSPATRERARRCGPR